MPPVSEPSRQTNSSSSLLSVRSGGVVNVPSLGVAVAPAMGTPVNPIGRIQHLTGLPASIAGDVGPVTPTTDSQTVTPPVVQMKTEPVTDSSLLNVTRSVAVSPVTGLHVKTEGSTSAGPTITSSHSNGSVGMIVTGTGSVTATPSVYTSAVTTTASSTTMTSAGSHLGKRIRRTSTKYEDYEPPQVRSCV